MASLQCLRTNNPRGCPVVVKWYTSTAQGSINGSHPQDIPADQTQVTFHLRGAYSPSVSQMLADHYSGENCWRPLPRAPLRSHAEYLPSCRCLLDEPGHERWQVLLRQLGCLAPDDWIAYAAQYATLPPFPAHLSLPAPVWSFLSSVVLYLQPTFLTALAKHMARPMPTQPTPPNAIHFTGFSAGAYTAIALGAENRLLSHRFQQPLLQPHDCAGDHQLVTNE